MPTDKTRAAELLEKACDGGYAASCSNLGLMYKRGDGLSADNTKALAYLKRTCDLGLPAACCPIWRIASAV